jgi:hypothetical protein
MCTLQLPSLLWFQAWKKKWLQQRTLTFLQLLSGHDCSYFNRAGKDLRCPSNPSCTGPGLITTAWMVRCDLGLLGSLCSFT